MASGFSPRPHTRGSGTVLLRAATLVAATGIGILASAAYLWITPPVYEASAELLIEADDPRAGPGPADDGMVETQAALIRSQVILDPLIEIESLQTDPTFAETAHEPVLKPAIRRIKAMLGTAEPEPEASPADYDAVLALLQERLTVRRKDGSNVLEIVMRNPDPDRAAELANSIIDLYFDELDAMPAAGSALEVPPGLVRLSIGIESADDLVADLRDALDSLR